MFFYPWYPAMFLAFEAGEVIDMRLWKIARGGEESIAESRMMAREKVDAFIEAGSVIACGGNSASVIEMYRHHVASNAKRLSDGRVPARLKEREWQRHVFPNLARYLGRRSFFRSIRRRLTPTRASSSSM